MSDNPLLDLLNTPEEEPEENPLLNPPVEQEVQAPQEPERKGVYTPEEEAYMTTPDFWSRLVKPVSTEELQQLPLKEARRIHDWQEKSPSVADVIETVAKPIASVTGGVTKGLAETPKAL